MSTVCARKAIELAEDLTKRATAFPSFRDLIEAGGNYRPTLKTSEGPDSDEYMLAELYDRAMEMRGDSRRACRY